MYYANYFILTIFNLFLPLLCAYGHVCVHVCGCTPALACYGLHVTFGVQAAELGSLLPSRCPRDQTQISQIWQAPVPTKPYLRVSSSYYE